MANSNSDDLLIKSQLLISKFRKQREVSLKKQDFVINKLSHCYSPIILDQINTSSFSNKIISDCDSFPQRDCDNTLLNKISNQYYHFNYNNTNKKPKNLNITKNDDITNIGNLSGSDNSIWSNFTESQNHDVKYKITVQKRECGVMTESCEKITLDDEEIFTPVTALPGTARSISDRKSRFSIQKEKFGSQKNEKYPSEIKETKYKKFASICTSHGIKEFNTQDIKTKSDNMIKSSNIFNDKVEVFTGKNENLQDENNKMKRALQLFEKEKSLENEISNQFKLLDRLNLEMEELTTNIGCEQENLNKLKSEKDELKQRRYEIFNGLSRELQSQIHLDRNLYNEQMLTDREYKHNNINNNSNSMSFVTGENFQKNDSNDDLFTLDSITVRNIVDKIILKEFSNSEDNIFVKNNEKIIVQNGHNEKNDQNSKEECILSDVYSIKDLKICGQTTKNNSDYSNIQLDSSNINYHNNCRIPPNIPKSKYKKIKTAHSFDNIAQYSTSTGYNHMRPYSRKKTRSPAVSVELKRYLHYQSSSDELSSEPNELIN